MFAGYPRLPTFIFVYQISQFGICILEFLGMENIGICIHGHLVYLMVIWYISWYFFPIWHVVSREIWQPCGDLILLSRRPETLASLFSFLLLPI
jgi:hypothetical protein